MSFFDTFTGIGAARSIGRALDFDGSQARGDLERADADANGMLRGGYDRATQQGERFYGDAQGRLDQYAQGGRDADGQIRNALGLNGREQQRGYYDNFQNDPGFEAEMRGGVRALDHSATARGGLYSGAAMRGVAQYGQQQQGNAYRNRLGSLMQYGQQGQQAATAQAGIASQFGQDRQNLEYGYGQQQAGNRINLGNALSANRGTMMRNVLGVAGTAARAYAASDIRVKRDIERVGALPSGLPVYSFRYVWSDVPHIGVMAQEARGLFPDAVAEHANGFLMVDYNAIG